MRKVILLPIVAVLALAGFLVYNRSDNEESSAQAAGSGQSQPGGRGGRGAARPPMPVEFAVVKRAPLTERILIVGNLIGAATVQVVPKVNGRLDSISVKLGDSVRRGQIIAIVENSEIQEQVRQAEASFQVGQATIRQRDADLKLAKTNLDRSRSLFERQLLPQQTYDDTQARYEAALRSWTWRARNSSRPKHGSTSCALLLETPAFLHPSMDSSASGSSMPVRSSRPLLLLCRSSTSEPCGWSRTSSRRT